MGEGSKIEWTHHTFNPWWGCTKVSAGCTRCYAESFSKRTGNAVWGDNAPRRFFGDKHWAEPLKWAAEARAAGHMRRVFCASMADVFEDRDDLEPHRIRLWKLIEATQDALDWLLLTKRPENIAKLGDTIISQCWLGTTVENQDAVLRLAHLRQHEARVHFVSAEPLLGPVEMRRHMVDGRNLIDWVIVGGESGPKSRPFDPQWARSLLEQCRATGTAFFMKQTGSNPGNVDDFERLRQFAEPGVKLPLDKRWPLMGKSGKGGELIDIPNDLRVREFPEVGP